MHANHDLIHFGDVTGDYAKIYRRPDGLCKFELTLQSKHKARVILDAYTPATLDDWHSLAKAALVAAIDFREPSSRRSKRPVQVESWRRFLGGAIKRTTWADFATPPDTDDLRHWEHLHRCIGQIHNITVRLRVPSENVRPHLDALIDTITLYQGADEGISSPCSTGYLFPQLTI